MDLLTPQGGPCKTGPAPGEGTEGFATGLLPNTVTAPEPVLKANASSWAPRPVREQDTPSTHLFDPEPWLMLGCS